MFVIRWSSVKGRVSIKNVENNISTAFHIIPQKLTDSKTLGFTIFGNRAKLISRIEAS